jgi:poly(A) polymerase
MTPAGKIEPQPWMTAPETRAVVAALTAGGAELRFVGGCVRDAVAERPVTDVDLATPEPPERVIALLERAGLKAVPTGIDHGTITAVSGGMPFEVTTLRVDVETYGRHAKVTFTDDWVADAARRDFTINALSCSPEGLLYDPFGGLKDLEAGQVRFVGDARARIREDYLRLLRFFRFHAHYGRGAPDLEGLAAASDLAPHLATLSGERIRNELFRLLTAPDPVSVLDIMLARAILAPVLPEARDQGRLAALLHAGPPELHEDPVLRLAALLATDRDGAAGVARRLRLSRDQRERLADLAAPPAGLAVGIAPLALRRFIYRLGAARVRDLVLLDWAGRRSGGQRPGHGLLDEALDEVARWQPKALPVQGRDLQKLGVPSGPELGRLMAQVEDWWIAQDFHPDRKACLERLQKMVSESNY